MRRAIANLIAALFVLPGCGIVPGSSDFACKGIPQGVACVGARAVYEKTNSRDRLSANEMSVNLSDDASTVRKPSAAEGASVGAMVDLRALDGSRPLRTPAAVMRIWIAPWESRTGDLNLPGYVFAEIEKRRWQRANDLPDRDESETAGERSSKTMPDLSPPSAIPAVRRNDRATGGSDARPPSRMLPSRDPRDVR